MLEETEQFQQDVGDVSEEPAANAEEEVVQAAEPNFLGEVEDEDGLKDIAKLGHQECDWILSEIEGMCKNTEDKFLETDRIAPMLATTMGYEDVDELEDALKGTLAEFIEMMPHFETQVDKEKHFFRMKPLVEGSPQCIRVRIKKVSDLYTVILKPGPCKLIIPVLEFEIGQNQEKSVNTVYNHIASAILNLSLQGKQGGWSEKMQQAVADTLIQLNALLDVNSPWDMIVKDSTGQAIVKPTPKADDILDYDAY